MGRIKKNSVTLNGIHGRIGEYVIKQTRHGAVLSKIPDMSKVKPSKLQKQKRAVFKQAVAYAQAILADPEKLKEYKKNVKRGKTVYHTAIAEYFRTNRIPPSSSP